MKTKKTSIKSLIFGLSLFVSACSQNQVFSRSGDDSSSAFLYELDSSERDAENQFDTYWQEEIRKARIDDRVKAAMGGIATAELATTMAAAMTRNSNMRRYIKDGLKVRGWKSYKPEDAPERKLYSFEYKDGILKAFQFDKESNTRNPL